jgi:catechol 2,3-dioxygenase
LRIEVNSGGYRNYVPDWKPNTWEISEGPNDMFRNTTLPQSTLEASRPTPKPTTTKQGIVPGAEADLIAAAATHANP